MDLDFSDDQKELRNHLRRFFAEKCPPGAVRAVLDGAQPFDRALYSELAQLGMLGAAIPEEYGGAGIGYLELCVLAEEAGRALAPVPISSSVFLAAEFLLAAGSAEQKQRWLPVIAAGEAVGTFAFAERAGRVTSATIACAVHDNMLSGRKIVVPDGAVADFAIVAAQADGQVGLFLAELSGPGVQRRAVETIDPARPLAELVFTDVPVTPLDGSDGWATIERVFDRAAVLLAFEQIGGAERALEMGRDYALSRTAFGRVIGSFQAIKHMLADMYVAVTLARSNAYFAAWALSNDAPELPVAAATARVSATHAFQLCAKNNIQVHGGVGFTWEFDCHLYYRRSQALALALGSLSLWESRLVERLAMRNHDQGAAR
ncbi:MAG: acyl-CoA dehydrogenase [Sphingomonadales bacterium]|nr:MAG: acyl-CoA dehydrogenase [Sphingomonadales bacterium]